MKTILSLLLTTAVAGTTLFAGDSKPSDAKSYFIDVHEFGPGHVDAAAIAAAHKRDVAAQARHGVRFIDYWIDAEHGRVYCLAEAPDAASVAAVHREANGLETARILAVTQGAPSPALGDKPLFLDIHEFGAGNVTAAGVADAHVKDLDVESEFGVNFLDYWVDEADGTVVCLSEADSADEVRETHRKAHGLLPVSIVKVTRGS